MINLNELKNINNSKGRLLKEGVYEFLIENVTYESNKVDKNQNSYEMWKVKLRLTDRNFNLIKNILVYDNDGVNDFGKEQLKSLIGLLNIDFANLTIEESELKDFLSDKLKNLVVVSSVYEKNGRSEVGWLYGIEDKERVIEKFQNRNQKFEKLDEAVNEIQKVDEVSPNEAHQVLENEVKVNEEGSTQANVSGTNNINYTDFIKFD